MVALDGTVVSVANPTIGRDLHASLVRPAVGHQRLPAGDRGAARVRRPARRSVRAQAAVHDRDGRVRARLAGLRAVAVDRRADPVPGRAGHVRRDDAAGDARLPASCVPLRRAREGGRDLGRDLGDRDRIGSDHRRPARPARLVGVDLPAEPPARRARARGRVLLDHRDQGRRLRERAGPGRRRPAVGVAVRARLGADQEPDARLGLGLHARLPRRRGRPDAPLHPLGEPRQGPADPARTVQVAVVLGRASCS